MEGNRGANGKRGKIIFNLIDNMINQEIIYSTNNPFEISLKFRGIRAENDDAILEPNERVFIDQIEVENFSDFPLFLRGISFRIFYAENSSFFPSSFHHFENNLNNNINNNNLINNNENNLMESNLNNNLINNGGKRIEKVEVSDYAESEEKMIQKGNSFIIPFPFLFKLEISLEILLFLSLLFYPIDYFLIQII